VRRDLAAKNFSNMLLAICCDMCVRYQNLKCEEKMCTEKLETDG
jgi:hypothetical protein